MDTSTAAGTEVHMPETGTATCSCSGHKVVVSADTDLRAKPNERQVMVAFWAQGSHGPYSPSWRLRIRQAWKWLVGRPDQADEVLLKYDEATKLMWAVIDATNLTWPERKGE